jgi:hypothetical protein
MKDASQQQTDPRSSGGLYPVIPPQLIRAAGNSAFAVAAAGLGLLAGVAIALTGCHTTVAPAPPKPAASQPVAQSTQPSAPSAPPAPNPAPVPVIQADSQKETSAAPKLSHPAHKASAAKPAETYYEPVQPAPRRQLYLNKYSTDPTSAKRAPYVGQSSPAATSKAAPVATIDPTSQPFNGTTALQLATAAAAAGPFVLCIEGDVTVANYDAATGTVETFERQTYVLSSAAGASGAIPWEDFPFNLHYRCDGSGNCTLYHSTAFASAKLVR